MEHDYCPGCGERVGSTIVACSRTGGCLAVHPEVASLRADLAVKTAEHESAMVAFHRSVKDGDTARATLAKLMEAAHQHVTRGHHPTCAGLGLNQTRQARVSMEYAACDCGFDIARAVIKEST